MSKKQQTAGEVETRIGEIDARVDELAARVHALPGEIGESRADGNAAEAERLDAELSEARKELEQLQAERDALDSRLPGLRQAEARPEMEGYRKEAERLVSDGAKAAGDLDDALNAALEALDKLKEIESESGRNAGAARQLGRRVGMEPAPEIGLVKLASKEAEEAIQRLGRHDALAAFNSMSPYRPVFVGREGRKN